MPPRNLLIIALTVVISLACYSAASKNKYANLFAEAMEVVDRQSLHVIPREKLFVSAMEGMLEDLDEHSMYISGSMFQSFDEEMKQEFGGVGMFVEIDPKSKNLVVLAPMPGTPAYEAGMKAGDQILTIDGVLTNDKPRREAIKLLRGPIGESVEVKIQRAEQKLTKSLKRAVIVVPSALGDYRTPEGGWKYTMKESPSIGYIRLTQFGEKSADEIRAALGEAGELEGLIVDLRNNSGGLLDVAIEICDMFLPSNLPIVRTRGRDKVLLQEHLSTSDLALNPSVPICVLVNRNSASASEIVAGCLQDHERAVLIGEQSWGKGTVQNVIPIRRGESALKLTTASYWRPSGKNIDRFDTISKETKKWGVQPDAGFEIKTDEDELFEIVRQRNIRDLRGLLTEEESEFVEKIRMYQPPEDESDTDSGEPSEGSKDQNAGADEKPAGSEAPKLSPMPDEKEPFVDRAIEKAIEYFESVLKSKSTAA